MRNCAHSYEFHYLGSKLTQFSNIIEKSSSIALCKLYITKWCNFFKKWKKNLFKTCKLEV